MSMKVTKKSVMENYKCIKVGYCKLDNLTRHLTPIVHTEGVYGWNADIYDVGDGYAIVTGYRPFGKTINSKHILALNLRAEQIDNCVFGEITPFDVITVLKNLYEEV